MPCGTEGRCHCGAVRISVSRPPADVTECRCSVCLRYGALWAYYPRADASIDGPTESYRWGRRQLAFHHCGVCGCVAGWTADHPGFGHRAVNARLLDSFDPDEIARIVEADASM